MRACMCAYVRANVRASVCKRFIFAPMYSEKKVNGFCSFGGLDHCYKHDRKWKRNNGITPEQAYIFKVIYIGVKYDFYILTSAGLRGWCCNPSLNSAVGFNNSRGF